MNNETALAAAKPYKEILPTFDYVFTSFEIGGDGRLDDFHTACIVFAM